MKCISYTRHAKNRMRWHKIHEFEVELAINSPDFEESSSGKRFNAWKKFPDKYLRVTYVDSNGELLVLTAVKKKKGWR
jgi:hypothetical protein